MRAVNPETGIVFQFSERIPKPHQDTLRAVFRCNCYIVVVGGNANNTHFRKVHGLRDRTRNRAGVDLTAQRRFFWWRRQ